MILKTVHTHGGPFIMAQKADALKWGGNVQNNFLDGVTSDYGLLLDCLRKKKHDDDIVSKVDEVFCLFS